jgi:hypothetical protein
MRLRCGLQDENASGPIGNWHEEIVLTNLGVIAQLYRVQGAGDDPTVANSYPATSVEGKILMNLGVLVNYGHGVLLSDAAVIQRRYSASKS